MTSVTELKGHYMKYLDEVLHPPHGTPLVAIYCDASTDCHGAAGVGVLIPDIALKESVQISNWESTAESVAIHHAIKKRWNSSDTQLSSLTAGCRELNEFSPGNMITNHIMHQVPRLSEQDIRIAILDAFSFKNINL